MAPQVTAASQESARDSSHRSLPAAQQQQLPRQDASREDEATSSLSDRVRQQACQVDRPLN